MKTTKERFPIHFCRADKNRSDTDVISFFSGLVRGARRAGDSAVYNRFTAIGFISALHLSGQIDLRESQRLQNLLDAPANSAKCENQQTLALAA